MSALLRTLITTTIVLSAFSLPAMVEQGQTAAAVGTPKENILGGLKSVAGGVESPGAEGGNVFPKGTIYDIANRVVRTFFAILAVLFLGMMLYGGYNWMTAMGDDEKITKAKETIISALIGVIIIIAAYAVTFFVINNLFTTTAIQTPAPAPAAPAAGAGR